MSNYGDTPGETPQDPYGQQPPQGPPGEPNYGQPPPSQNPYGQPPSGQAPYGGATSGEPFSVGNAFSYGWKKFQANLGPILIAALVLLAAVVLIQIISTIFTGGNEVEFTVDPDTGAIESDSGGMLGGSIIASLFFGLISQLVGIAIQAGIAKGALDITKGKPISVGSMFAGINWVQVIIASLIIAVASIIGFVLCILPGIAVVFLTSFTLYFLIDKDMPAVDAIKASIAFTRANAGTLIVFFLACIAAFIVGALLCGVGLLVAIPVVVIASAYTYRTLQGEPVAA